MGSRCPIIGDIGGLNPCCTIGGGLHGMGESCLACSSNLHAGGAVMDPPGGHAKEPGGPANDGGPGGGAIIGAFNKPGAAGNGTGGSVGEDN